ncbi:50S ribosomal protein L32 [Chloroflexota bacterium]
MALPKRKYAKARQGKRRGHLGLSPSPTEYCPQCHNAKLPHHACPTCGSYAGREAIKIKSPKQPAS